MGIPPKLSILLSVCLAGGLTARTKTDVVVMTNGDRFTCEIEKLERGVLYTSFDYVDGTVAMQWSKVARVESSQLFIVHTQDGSIFEGTIRTTENPGQKPVRIEVLEPSKQSALLEQGRVVELAPTTESVWRRFSGHFNSGLMYTKGNETTQYNMGADLRVRGEHWRFASDFVSNFSKSSEVVAASRNQSRLWARRVIGGRRAWYYSAAAEFLHSSQQGINLQTTLGAGFGRFLRDSNTARLAVTAYLAVQQTRYESSTKTDSRPNALGAMFAGDLHLFRFKKTSFDLTASALPILTEIGRIRSYANTAYSIQVVSTLWFKLSFYGSWDNRPPSNFSGSDYGVSSSISYSFN